MRILIAQCLGVLIAFLSIIIPQFKKKQQMLVLIILSNLLSGINFLLMESYSAVGIAVVAILQASKNLISDFRGKKTVSMAEKICFTVLFVIGGLMPYIVSGDWAHFGVLESLPVLASLMFMCGVMQKSEQGTRAFMLCNGIMFFIYNLINRNTQCLAQVVSMTSNITALIRYRKKKDLPGGQPEKTSEEKESI